MCVQVVNRKLPDNSEIYNCLCKKYKSEIKFPLLLLLLIVFDKIDFYL